ncbi:MULTISPECIES: DUF4058 family protein [unclassified Desertifilum]|uniref:DUF4058 family protein n=1 Tax=unclassified Desertifilum TaxID=2621682 RepID=UPI001F558C87|nr:MULTISPECIES: DUF4058 family protein [unclassified Desertifilum]MDA0211209.1 DUF4058 family protein [Cyanobacteria bacterium FC1]
MLFPHDRTSPNKPYLENPELWSAVHSRLIVAIAPYPRFSNSSLTQARNALIVLLRPITRLCSR